MRICCAGSCSSLVRVCATITCHGMRKSFPAPQKSLLWNPGCQGRGSTELAPSGHCSIPVRPQVFLQRRLLIVLPHCVFFLQCRLISTRDIRKAIFSSSHGQAATPNWKPPNFGVAPQWSWNWVCGSTSEPGTGFKCSLPGVKTQESNSQSHSTSL